MPDASGGGDGQKKHGRLRRGHKDRAICGTKNGAESPRAASRHQKSALIAKRGP